MFTPCEYPCDWGLVLVVQLTITIIPFLRTDCLLINHSINWKTRSPKVLFFPLKIQTLCREGKPVSFLCWAGFGWQCMYHPCHRSLSPCHHHPSHLVVTHHYHLHLLHYHLTSTFTSTITISFITTSPLPSPPPSPSPPHDHLHYHHHHHCYQSSCLIPPFLSLSLSLSLFSLSFLSPSPSLCLSHLLSLYLSLSLPPHP